MKWRKHWRAAERGSGDIPVDIVRTNGDELQAAFIWVCTMVDSSGRWSDRGLGS